jgi:autotransporter-associated beta strand protein
MKPSRNLFLGSVIALSAAQSAQAADYWWDPLMGSWGTGANWSDAAIGGTTGTVPLAGDSVIFNQSSGNGATNVRLDAARSITGITFSNTGTTAVTSGFGTNILTLGTGGISLDSGAGAATLNTSIRLDGSQSWINNSTVNPFLVSSAISNVGDVTPFALTIGGAGDTRLNGVISNGGATGTTALVKSGLGTLTIGTTSGVANTFSGGTTINANSGTVVVANTGLAGLGNGPISIGSGSTLQYNTSTRGTANTISNAFSGAGTIKLYSSPMLVASGFSMGGSTFSSFTGTIQLSNNGTNGSDGSKLNAGSATFNASGASLVIDSGSQLYYAGGSNTATFGSISVSGNGGNEGRGALRIESGTLAGNITLTGSSVWGAASGISGSITGTATTGNTQTLTLGTISQNGAGTLRGVISNGAGGGTLALTKRNTGTLNLTGTAVNTFTGGLNVDGGTLSIDYTAAGSPLVNLVNAGNAVSLGGGTLGVRGAASGTTSQSFTNGVNFASGTSGVTINRNGGTSTTLNLGTITHSVGGVASFSSTTALVTAASTTEMIKVTNGTTAAGTALGAWALGGAPTASPRYIAVDASGALKLVTANTTIGTNWSSVNSPTQVYTTNAAVSLSTNPTAQALQNPATGNILVQLNGQTLTTNGFLAIPTSGTPTWSFTRTGSGGITVGAENELVIAGNGNVTISAPIANKSGNNSSLTYAGGGTLTLNTVASTYTGTTTVNSGTLTLGLANVTNSASNLVVNGGTVGISTFDQSVAGVKVTGSGAITSSSGILTSASTYDIQSSGTISAILAGNVGLNKTTDFNATLSGANTFTGDVNIKAGALTISTPSNPTPLGNTANMVYLGDASGIDYATLNFGNSINVANPVTVQSGSAGAKTIKSDNVAGEFSGNLTLNDDLYLWTASGNGRLTLSGSSINLGSKALRYTNAGTSPAAFTLSGTATGATGSVEIVGSGSGTSIFSSTGSTYGGGTVLGGVGTVQIDASSTGSVTSGPFGTGTVTLNGAAVNAGVTADQTIANAITIAENTTFANQTNEKSLTFSGATTLANGDRTLTVNLGTTVAGKGVTFSNAIGDNGQGLGLIKAGTGLLTLSGTNTYTGTTTVGGGTLSVSADQNLGLGNTLSLGGNLQITGTSAFSSSKAVNLTANSTIDVANLEGAGIGSLSGAFQFTKTGAGKLTTGGTTNSIKNLVLANELDLGNGTLTISNAGGDTIRNTANATISASGTGTLSLTQGGATDGGNVGAANGTTLTISAPIIGSNAFESFHTANGTGVVVLSGTNTYSGNNIINSGVLSVANIGNQGSLTSNLGSGSTISFGSTSATTGTLRYTGSAATSDRIINLSGTTAGGTIEQAGASGLLKFTSDFTATGNGAKTLTLTGSTAGTGEVSGKIVNSTGTTSLAKSGTGTWMLSGVNTYSGRTTITGGMLEVTTIGDFNNAGGSLGTAADVALTNTAATGATSTNSIQLVNSAGGMGLRYIGSGESTNRAIFLNTQNNATIDSSGASGGLTLSGPISWYIQNSSTQQNANLNLTGTNTADNTLSGTFTELSGGATSSALNIVKQGSGTWALTGNRGNRGLTIVEDGTLKFDSVANSGINSALGFGNQLRIGAAPAGTVAYHISLGTATTAGTLEYTGLAASASNRVIGLNGNGAIKNTTESATNTLTFSGGISSLTAGSKTLTLGGTNSGTNTLSGVIANGSGALAISKADAGTWVLTNSNTYTGGTTISAGTLSAGNIVVSGGGSNLGNATSAVVLGSAGAQGILSYTGNSANYTRGFTIGGAGGGRLDVTTSGQTLSIGTAAIDGAGDFTVGGAGNTTVDSTISHTGGIIKTGAGILSIRLQSSGAPVANTFTGGASILEGTITLANPLGSGGQAVTPGGSSSATYYLGDTSGSSTATLSIGNNNVVFNNPLEVRGGSSGIKTFSISGPSVTGSHSGTITLNDNLTLSTAATTSTLNLSGVIEDGDSGAKGIRVSGSGQVTVSNTNTYTGNTNVSGGTLLTTKAAALSGYDTAGKVAVNGGTLALRVAGSGWSAAEVASLVTNVTKTSGNLALDTTNGNFTPVSALDVGALGLVKNGTNTLTLDQANSFTGNVSVNAGTLKIADSGALGTGAKTLTSAGGSRVVQLSGGVTLGNNISLSMSSNSGDGLGLSSIDGDNTIQGNINYTTGNPALNVSSSGTSKLTISGNLTYTVANNSRVLYLGGDSTAANEITGNVGQSGTEAVLQVYKQGTGSWALSGTSSHTGATQVNGGILAINGSLTQSAVTVNTGGTLQGSGSISSSVTVKAGGTIATGNSIESLATGALSLEALATFAYEINNDAAAGLAGDLTAVTGALNLDLGNLANLTLGELGGGSWSANEKLTLISYTGAWNGGLFRYNGSTLANNSTFSFSGTDWRFQYDDSLAGDNFTDDLTGTSFVTMTAVPEPRAALLASLSLLALLRRRRAA